MKNHSNFPGIPLIESPFFKKESENLPSNIKKIAEKLNEDGFAIFDFPDADINKRADEIQESLKAKYDFQAWIDHGWQNGSGLRLSDAWEYDENVRSIATNKNIIDLLEMTYGRKAFPFQTLNFPVGSQQHYHSDTMHFNTIPERWMCGVWVALEDIDENNGPLVYYPGTHKWPIMWGEHIGLDLSNTSNVGQHLFDPFWEKSVELAGIQPQYLNCKKGQALIWTSNLLHGGAKQIDRNRTRWSQVTHYYFENCTYWRPYASDLSSGNIFSFQPPNILTGQKYQISKQVQSQLPSDFNPKNYIAKNQDLYQISEISAAEHWIIYGKKEGRRY